MSAESIALFRKLILDMMEHDGTTWRRQLYPPLGHKKTETSPSIVTIVDAGTDGLCAVSYMVSTRLDSDPEAIQEPNYVAIIAAKAKLAPLD